MSISIQQTGNTVTILANTSSGTTTVSVRATGTQQIGSWMIDNLDTGNSVQVNLGFANTVSANNSQGFGIPARSTKYVNLMSNPVTPATTVYLVANAVSGTAQVSFTPVYIFK